MKTLIFIATQGPHCSRNGREELFDWRISCKMAAEIQRARPGSVIYVPSAFGQAGSTSEYDFYKKELEKNGVPKDALFMDRHGHETVEQCELALALAEKENAELTVISTFVHFRRIRYLFRDRDVEHYIAYGTPNRWLQFTHIILTVGFPLIDALGLREWWKNRIIRRRLKGIQ